MSNLKNKIPITPNEFTLLTSAFAIHASGMNESFAYRTSCDLGLIYVDSKPKRCHCCGSDSTTDTVTDSLDWQPVEWEIHCSTCGEFLGVYSYGSYFPFFI